MIPEEPPLSEAMIRDIERNIEQWLNCDHDWQLEENTSSWLRDRQRWRCTKCRSVRIDAKAFDPGGTE